MSSEERLKETNRYCSARRQLRGLAATYRCLEGVNIKEEEEIFPVIHGA